MNHPLEAYHGSISRTTHQQVDALFFNPQSSGHMRVHTKEHFIPPIQASWWVYTLSDRRPGGTSGGANQDGLHTHIGHLGNDMNYNIHLVRRDGRSKVALEQGLSKYRDLRFSTGVPLRLWRRYMFHLVWLPDQVTLSVSNDNHVGAESGHGNVEHASITMDLPPYGPPSGQLGWRFDNIVTRFGGLTVRPL